MSAADAQMLSLALWFGVTLGATVLLALLAALWRSDREDKRQEAEALALADSKLWVAALRERSKV